MVVLGALKRYLRYRFCAMFTVSITNIVLKIVPLFPLLGISLFSMKTFSFGVHFIILFFVSNN